MAETHCYLNSSIQANPNAFGGLCWPYMQIVLKATSGRGVEVSHKATNHVFDAFSKPNLKQMSVFSMKAYGSLD